MVRPPAPLRPPVPTITCAHTLTSAAPSVAGHCSGASKSPRTPRMSSWGARSGLFVDAGVGWGSAKRSRAVAAALCSRRARCVWRRGAAGLVFGVLRAHGVMNPDFLACCVLSYVCESGPSQNLGRSTSFFPGHVHASFRATSHYLDRNFSWATVTSISGPPDGRNAGCSASHTSAGTIRCLDTRLIDERTPWATSSEDLPPLKARLASTRRGLAATVTSISGPPDSRNTGC
jgi:hypothetical protein